MSTQLTAEQRATLTQYYAEATAALHQLRIGRGVVSVRDSNGEMVTYQAANAGDLMAYIIDLERQLFNRHRSRPAFPVF